MKRILFTLFILGCATTALAALDSKNKRGSAINMGLPYRVWLAEPDGTLDANDRVSLLKLCSAQTPAAPGASPIPVIIYQYEQRRRQEEDDGK